MTTQSTRWQEITAIWKDNRWLYIVAGLLLGMLVSPAVEQITGDLNGLIGNLVPEAIGIVFTVLILDRLNENRSKEALKHRLLNEVRSPSSATAVTALDWLRRETWIDDNTFKQKTMMNLNWERAYIGDLNLEEAVLARANFENVINIELLNDDTEVHFLNLQKTDLTQANLANAILAEANLYNAVLAEANLYKANLYKANLVDASLKQANLTNAVLAEANLTQASLWQANLTRASLYDANLCKANLRQSYLKGADLEDAQFDEKTVLPDAQYQENNDYDKYWTPNTDMRRYTDLKHPDFWQPPYLKRGYEGTKPAWLTDDMLVDD